MQEKEFRELIENLSGNKILELNLSYQEITTEQSRTILKALTRNTSVIIITWINTRIAEAEKNAIQNIILARTVLPGALSSTLAQYRQDAEHGDITKQYLLGWMYDKGSEVSPDQQEAIRWYTRVARQGHKIAQYNLACLYLTVFKDDKTHAIYWATKAIESPGIPEAHLLLAYLSEIEGGEPKLRAAAQFYQRAAEAGSDEACIQLSRCYRDGVGVEKNIKEAMICLKKPIEHENTKALFEMGCLYDSIKNDEEAFKCYARSSEGGDVDALYVVGRRYYDVGRCFYNDTLYHVFDDFYTIREQNLTQQAYQIIQQYHGGIMTVSQNIGLDFITTAAYRGSAEAQYFLGIKRWLNPNNEMGSMLNSDGLAWMRMAAKQGHVNAQLIFCSNTFIYNHTPNATAWREQYDSNTKEALTWCLSAVNQGDQKAFELLSQKYTRRLKPNNMSWYLLITELISKALERVTAPQKPSPAIKLLSKLSSLPSTAPEATIYAAAKHNQLEVFQTWIKFPGLDVLKLNSKALVIALENNAINFARQLLLLEGIDVNFIADKGMTPLELVIQASNLNTFKLIVNKKGFNANLHHPLLKTVLDEEESMVKLLLAIPNLDVNATETPGSESALWLASKHGNTSIVKLLLTHQDINVDYRCNVLSADEKEKTGKKKLTAQEIANVYGHEAVVTVIQDYKDVKFLREQAVSRRQKIKDELGAANNNLIQETGNQEENLSSRMKQYEEEIEQLKAQRKQFETQMLQQQVENQQMARQMNEMFMLFKASFGQSPKNPTTETLRIETVSDSNSVAPVTTRSNVADILK